MEAWVLGCGPSLGEVCIPPHVFTVGVNNSYLQHWSPVYATCDSGALARDFGRAAALLYFSGINPKKVGLEGESRIEFIPKVTIARSGTFGYLVALLLGASRVKLLGFDMDWRQGHFANPEVQPVNYDTHTKPVLGFYLEKFGIPTLIWRDRWVPLESVL